MEQKETILRVKNLRISFRTVSGKVQAVRDVSFNLEKGKTLAIVGESGSGKSVTTRAALGILAKNAIVENGEILYDGKDILKLSEWELHKIRGEKISMIFQDPLSSLNPIIRIGRQLTEAPVLKAASNRKENRAILKDTMDQIRKTIANCGNNESIAKGNQLLKDFYKIAEIYTSLYLPYSYASSFLKDAKMDLDEIIFDLEHEIDSDLTLTILELLKLIEKSLNPHLLKKTSETNKILSSIRKKIYPIYLTSKIKKRKKNQFQIFLTDMKELNRLIEPILSLEKPDFFSIAFQKVKGNEDQEKFLLSLKALLKKAAEESSDLSKKNTKKAIETIENSLPIFKEEKLNRQAILIAASKMTKAVLLTIDPLSPNKDSYSYTFKGSLQKAIETYWNQLKTNEKETKRYNKEKALLEKKTAKGKKADFKVAPANVIPEERLRENIVSIIENLLSIYKTKEAIETTPDTLFTKISDLFVLSKKKHTKFMAKMVAIRLMKEVGIPEPRKRFRQYPFEFSGGMRQRIVIAIALTSNPEILICDEPTTALDVTIQAQILELINRIKEERHLSVIFITHNLGVVANMADEIAVMYAGQIVEYGTSNDIFYDPKHPYTWALLSSMPDLETKEKLDAIPGTPPNMIYPPIGDAFAARNKYALKIDFRKEPPLFEVSPTHFAKTWLLAKEAPIVLPPEIVLRRIGRMEERYGKDIDKEMEEELRTPANEAYSKIATKADPMKAKRLNVADLLKKEKGESYE